MMTKFSIPDVEFKARIERTRAAMAKHNLDTLLAFPPSRNRSRSVTIPTTGPVLRRRRS